MQPYINLKGKGRWANFWGDKVSAKFKKVFNKSKRQENKKLINKTLLEH